MKITRDFLIDLVDVTRFSPQSKSSVSLIAHPAGAAAGDESFSWTMVESLLGTVGLPGVDKIVGLSLHCEMTSEPLTEAGLKDPFTLLITQISQAKQFALGDQGLTQTEISHQSLGLSTGGPGLEERVTCYATILLSPEEYAAIEKLDAGQCFKMSVTTKAALTKNA